MKDTPLTHRNTHPPGPPNTFQVKDALTGEEWTVRAKVVVNATGVFADHIRKMDDPEAVELIEPAAGAWVGR